MRVGDCVHVRHDATRDHTYGPANNEKRLAHDGRIGRITDFHDAHGYSFVVGFTDQTQTGFDIDELTVVTQRQWTDHVRQRVPVGSQLQEARATILLLTLLIRRLAHGGEGRTLDCCTHVCDHRCLGDDGHHAWPSPCARCRDLSCEQREEDSR